MGTLSHCKGLISLKAIKKESSEMILQLNHFRAFIVSLNNYEFMLIRNSSLSFVFSRRSFTKLQQDC